MFREDRIAHCFCDDNIDDYPIWVAHLLHKYGETRNDRIVIKRTPNAYQLLDEIFVQAKMQSKKGKQLVDKELLESNWTVRGKKARHDKLAKLLLAQEDIISLVF